MQALTIAGHRGHAIPARLIRASGKTLAIVLPGLRYSNAMPALHYTQQLMQARGADLLAVDYDYPTNAEFMAAPEAEQLDWIGADGRAIFSAALAAGRYDDIVVIGKSLGTIAMGRAIPEMPGLETARLVWLTPSLIDTGLAVQMTRCRQPGFVAIGTADPNYAALQADGKTLHVLDGLDHALDRPGDPAASAIALAGLLEALSDWLDATR